MIASIVETARMREDLLRAEVRLTLQIKALCRRAASARCEECIKKQGALCPPHTRDSAALYKSMAKGEDHPLAAGAVLVALPLLQARALVSDRKSAVEKDLRQLARKLPVWTWVEQVRGLGDLGLALIVGEAGDLSNYANPAKLWKRMGLAVIGGQRQRRVAGDPALAIEHGYCPRRRSLMWNLGESMVKTGDAYRQLYLERKEYECRAAIERGLTVLPAAKIPKADAARYISKGHVHNRARRYMEKRLLKDLWAAWRKS